MSRTIQLASLALAASCLAAPPTVQRLASLANGGTFVSEMEWTVEQSGTKSHFKGAIQEGTYYVQTIHDDKPNLVDVSGQNCKDDWRLVDQVVEVAEANHGPNGPNLTSPNGAALAAYRAIRSAASFGLQFVAPGTLDETSPGSFTCMTDPRVTKPVTNAVFTIKSDPEGRPMEINYRVSGQTVSQTRTISYGDGGFPIVITSNNGPKVTIQDIKYGKFILSDSCGFVPAMFAGMRLQGLTVWSNSVPYAATSGGTLKPIPAK